MRDVLARHDATMVVLFESLTDDEWERASLCTGWQVRDVLAHLVVGCRLPLGALVWEMATRRASFDAVNDRMARRLGEDSSPASLLDEFGTRVGDPRLRTRALFPARLQLGDRVTHHLDVTLALDRDPTLDPDAAAAVLATQVALPNPFVPARRRAAGLHLEATDVDWCRPLSGAPVVRGGAAALISVLGGRPQALEQLTGTGVATLRDRVARGRRVSSRACRVPPRTAPGA